MSVTAPISDLTRASRDVSEVPGPDKVHRSKPTVYSITSSAVEICF